MKKQQQGLFDLLRNVSIRLPLLIFGTATDFDESIRLAEFVDKVDAASWKEFMPKEVDKPLFLKLLVFYDEDVIEGAGMRIRLMAKAADELMPTQRVMKIAEMFSYFKNPAKETVLTPWHVVNMHMGDTIGRYNFYYVAYSLYRMMLPKDEEQMALEEAQVWWQQTLKDHLFVLCQTTMVVAITKCTLAGYTGAAVNAIYLTKLLDRMDNKQRLARKLMNPRTWEKEGERLKFDAVVGNPPYQKMDGGNSASAVPIYQAFVEQAIALKPSYVSMIVPSRWFAGGRGLDRFREMMMNNTQLSKLCDFSESKYIFPTADISGGICYFLLDKEYDGPCEFSNVDVGTVTKEDRYLNEFSIVVQTNRAIDILHKVLEKNEDLLKNYVSSMKPFGLRTYEEPDETGKLILRWNKGKGPVEESRITVGHQYIDQWKVISSRFF